MSSTETVSTEAIELEPLSATVSHRKEITPPAADNESTLESSSTSPKKSSTFNTVLTVFQPSAVNFFSSFTNGIITVGLPVIARSIDLPRSLYLWPASVFGLTSGAMLLIAGSIADILGARKVEIVGIWLFGLFTLASGLSTSGVQLVVFRALQGIAMAMHLPASVSLIAAAVPKGRARNIGFACLGLSQPLGFSVGLVLSGVLIDRAGWRSGFYLSGAAMLVIAVMAIWTLPADKMRTGNGTVRPWWKSLWLDVDWIGGSIASGGLAILAYVLAILSADLSTIHSATTASLLSISLLLLISFPFWMHRRQRTGKPALIPNSLWKNMSFTSTCIMVALSYGVMNSMELFSSLYFQEIQKNSVMTTSLYLLPNLAVGVCINLTVGLFVHRVPARWLVTISALLCAVAPLIMAVVNPDWSYWYLAFWAQIFAPMSGDVLFTVGLIIVSDSFPEETQALAGAVFSTVGQFGMSLGMGLTQVVALGVMGVGDDESGGGHGDGGAFEGVGATEMLKGYRAGFWFMFGIMVLCGLMAVVGLRKVGKVGVKRD